MSKPNFEIAETYLNRADQIFLAAYWNWHLESGEFKKALYQFIKNNSKNKKIYILGQVPMLKSNPLRNLRFSSIGLKTKTITDKSFEKSNEYLSKLARDLNIIYLDFNSLELFRSPPYFNDQILYYDKHHLNEIGTVEYAKQAKLLFEIQ